MESSKVEMSSGGDEDSARDPTSLSSDRFNTMQLPSTLAKGRLKFKPVLTKLLMLLHEPQI